MSRAFLLWGATFALAAALSAASASAARPSLVVERVVIVMRHGVRAPLEGEVPPGTRTSAPWPEWSVAPGMLTPHGAAALAQQGTSERRWLALRGMIASRRCPAPGDLRIWTNTAPRTIASGSAFVAGMAPGCALPIGHLEPDAVDPLFEPLRADSAPFDAGAAIASIVGFTGGIDRLAMRHAPELRLLEQVLGCAPPGPCDPGGPPAVTASADGRSIDLTGSIRTASGTAQVLLLEYAQGMPRRQVGWGRAGPAVVRRLGALHAALFDVFTRPPYMMARQAGPLARHIVTSLTASRGPRVEILVGHDTNVTALAALLGVALAAPGYATDDVPPGGALVLERVRRRVDGRRFVRVTYHSQSPSAIRRLSSRVTRTTLRLADCAEGTSALCPLPRFADLVDAGTVPSR